MLIKKSELKNNNMGIELIENSIIDTFIMENIKQLQLIKTCESYEIYSIKNYDIMLYITKNESEKRVFNTQIFKNLYNVSNLSIDMIITLFDNFIFM
jgi:hypothetical protein